MARCRPVRSREPRSRILAERLRACLLDEREGLGAGEEPETLAREPGPRERRRERAQGLDPEVHPGVSLPRQPFDERVTDRAATARRAPSPRAAPRRTPRRATRSPRRRPAAARPSSKGSSGCTFSVAWMSGIVIPIPGQTSSERTGVDFVPANGGAHSARPARTAESPAAQARRRPREPDAGNAAVGRLR